MNVVENLSTKIPLTVHSGVTVQEGRTTEGRLRVFPETPHDPILAPKELRM